MTPDKTKLTIVAALNCEAKPWVDHYRLKRVCDKPFSLYQSEGGEVEVVISGIGALAAATAVGWLAGVSTSEQRIWLNVGIAGHAEYALGTISRVHSYVDAQDLKHYYPPMTARWKGSSDALLSVNAPSNSYPESAMVDMEGLGFYRSATNFSSAELVQSLKVVSDNSDNGFENLNASKITQLMLPHTDVVVQFAASLLALVDDSSINTGLLCEEALNVESHLMSLRGTHSQKQQLQSLMNKASVLDLSLEIAALGLDQVTDMKQALGQLSTLIDQAVPAIGENHG